MPRAGSWSGAANSRPAGRHPRSTAPGPDWPLVAHAPHSVWLSQPQPQLGCAGQRRSRVRSPAQPVPRSRRRVPGRLRSGRPGPELAYRAAQAATASGDNAQPDGELFQHRRPLPIRIAPGEVMASQAGRPPGQHQGTDAGAVAERTDNEMRVVEPDEMIGDGSIGSGRSAATMVRSITEPPACDSVGEGGDGRDAVGERRTQRLRSGCRVRRRSGTGPARADCRRRRAVRRCRWRPAAGRPGGPRVRHRSAAPSASQGSPVYGAAARSPAARPHVSASQRPRHLADGESGGAGARADGAVGCEPSRAASSSPIAGAGEDQRRAGVEPDLKFLGRALKYRSMGQQLRMS